MKLETPIIALLLGSLLFTGLFTLFVVDLGTTYGADMNVSVFRTKNNEASLESTFDRINETKKEMDELNAQFQDEQVTDSGSLFGFLKLTWTIGKQTMGSVNIMKDMLYGFSEIIGIPPVWVATAVAIVLIVMIISIVMLLAGRTY